jgi:DNA-binding MarR family transcriptional regulator
LLESEGLVAKQANDAHARSQLVVLTPAGRSAYARADRRWTAEAARLGKSASVLEWNAAAELVARIADQLESDVREGRSSS